MKSYFKIWKAGWNLLVIFKKAILYKILYFYENSFDDFSIKLLFCTIFFHHYKSEATVSSTHACFGFRHTILLDFSHMDTN